VLEVGPTGQHDPTSLHTHSLDGRTIDMSVELPRDTVFVHSAVRLLFPDLAKRDTVKLRNILHVVY